MTIKEYDEKVANLADNGKFEELSALQYSFMKNVLLEYKAEAKKNAMVENKIAVDLLTYCIYNSTSGNAIVNLSEYELTPKEFNDAVGRIQNGSVFELLGDYLLEEQNYEDNGDYVIDVIFGGNYVPNWDGWNEE